MSDVCRRCGAPTPTYSFERDSTFWGFLEVEQRTVTTRSVRVLGHYLRREGPGSSNLVTDEKAALCSDCWGLFVHKFLHGKAVPAVKRAES